MASILPTPDKPVEARLPAIGSWQSALKAAIRSGAELCRQLELDPRLASSGSEADFPVLVPQEYLRRMRIGDPQDPLLRQVLGTEAELQAAGLKDPVGDLDFAREAGMLQKYAGRVLLVASGACAVHCRYCFRRHFPYAEVPTSRQQWQRWLAQLAADTDINEVILSGGDPLSVVDHRLQWFVDELNRLEHIRRLRVHTRLPVVIPQRVCSELLDWVRAAQATVYFVVHINHPQEIDAGVEAMFQQLHAAGVVLLNQAVLLRGINDDYATLYELCSRLIDGRVLPYYLHQLDRVQGATHFEVADQVAVSLVTQLRANLPGYAVPQLVREIPGQPSKTPVL